MKSKYSKNIRRETNLIIFSAFLGGFMGVVINQLVNGQNFLANIIYTFLFISLLYITVPTVLRGFRN
jgi:hypothetical protein